MAGRPVFSFVVLLVLLPSLDGPTATLLPVCLSCSTHRRAYTMCSSAAALARTSTPATCPLFVSVNVPRGDHVTDTGVHASHMQSLRLQNRAKPRNKRSVVPATPRRVTPWSTAARRDTADQRRPGRSRRGTRTGGRLKTCDTKQEPTVHVSAGRDTRDAQ
jgi:hypothetical protein